MAWVRALAWVFVPPLDKGSLDLVRVPVLEVVHPVGEDAILDDLGGLILPVSVQNDFDLDADAGAVLIERVRPERLRQEWGQTGKVVVHDCLQKVARFG